MANSLVPKPNELAKLPTTDFSETDQKKVDAYKEAGLPGIYEIKPEQLKRMVDLYFMGKPYSQISRILMIDKTRIMFLSDKYQWFNSRQEYHHELEATIRNRIIAEKVDNQDFVLKMTHFIKRKLSKKMDKYFATDSESDAEAVDSKEMAQAVKLIETLENISTSAAAGRPVAPAVGLHLGDGVTVSKNDDGTVDITPKTKTVGEMLEAYAKAKREEEKKPK